jgi:chromosome segregation ATPase
LVESKKYSRRLESSLASASKSTLASEVVTLQSQLSTLQAQCSQSKSDLEALNKSLAAAVAENQRLATALEVKAEDFGLVGDLRAQLLYEVAESRNERERAERAVKPLEADVALLRKQLEGTYTTIEELKLVREANNEEMIKLEGNLHAETEVRIELEAELERALEEKARLLALVSELNKRQTTASAVKSEDKGVITDLDDTVSRLEREVRDRDEAMRRQAALHKQEIGEMRGVIAGLETTLLQVKAGSPPPPQPVSQVESPPAGETTLLRKIDLPADPSRFRALIAEERRRTEELMRRYRPKP